MTTQALNTSVLRAEMAMTTKCVHRLDDERADQRAGQRESATGQ